ncbi:MAG: tRNA (guanosine(37)-N1)-methyltransferase TrmD, partial [Alphaproteobacteria bacterium]|nr:tRNA (guanosine(37)-N1)-methyltransferase TrmD [Alphaproteobacteria bacterium]
PLFPEMFPGTLGGGVVGRALENGAWSYHAINPRDFATDNYNSVDDEQFGGGAGMVMKPDVLAAAIDSIPVESRGKIIYFSPRGKVWNQRMAREFAASGGDYTIVCGRYEGIDQRVIDEYEIMEISVGDYILSGGEIAAQVFIDSMVRLLDNVVHSPESTANESFEIGGLEWPLYTRPSAWRGRNVPEVLLSGHHGNIERWRKEQSDDITKERRPDLIKID